MDVTEAFTEIKGSTGKSDLMEGRLGGGLAALGMIAYAQQQDSDPEGGLSGVAGYHFLQTRSTLVSLDIRFLRQLDYVASVVMAAGFSDDEMADAVYALARAFAADVEDARALYAFYNQEAPLVRQDVTAWLKEFSDDPELGDTARGHMENLLYAITANI